MDITALSETEYMLIAVVSYISEIVFRKHTAVLNFIYPIISGFYTIEISIVGSFGKIIS